MDVFHRQLNTAQLWVLAVGMVISGQYFGWNYGFSAGLFNLVLATLLVSVFYITFMLTYAELAAAMPAAGGAMVYAQAALGSGFGYFVGLACLVEFLFATPAIAVATGSYLHFLIPQCNAHMATLIVLVLFVLLNLNPIKRAIFIEMIATLLALLGLLLFYCFGLSHPVTSTVVSHSHPQHWTHFVYAIPFAIWLYLAIEGGALSAEEVKEPSTTLPRGLLLAITTIGLCSVLTVLTTARLLPSQYALIDYPLPKALAGALGAHSIAVKLVGCLGVFGLLASLHGILLGCSRQMFALSRAGFLPRGLQRLSSSGVPVRAVILTGLIAFVCAASAQLAEALIEMAVFAAMTMYLGALISWFILHYRGALVSSRYHVPWRGLPVIAFITCFICWYAVLRYALLGNSLSLLGYHCSIIHLLIILALIAVGYYSWIHSRHLAVT